MKSTRGRARSIVIGLTGGPGVGKSLAAEYLEDDGAVILSGDEAGRKAVEIPAVKRRLMRAFGSEISDSRHAIDRRKLGATVFDNAEALGTLNEIVHPTLLRILKAELIEYKKKRAPLIVIDAALIFEWGIADWCDYLLVVTAKKDIRIGRIIKSGLTRKEAASRIRSQISDSVKVALADYVIANNGSRSDLRRNVLKFLGHLPLKR